MSHNNIKIGIYALTGKKLGSITQQCADIYTLTGKKVAVNCPENSTVDIDTFFLQKPLPLPNTNTNLKPI
jgi:hypothetical protein